jgi:Mg2+ and Co2+ transporter CorA
MALKSDQMNNTMERLAVLTMVLTPMGVIVGLFGMNVQVPGQADMNPTYLGFIIICGCMLSMALTCIGIYAKYGF